MFYGSSKVDVEKMVLVVNGVGFCLVIVFGFFFWFWFDFLINDLIYKVFIFKEFDLYEGLFRCIFLYVKDVVCVFVFVLNNYD